MFAYQPPLLSPHTLCPCIPPVSCAMCSCSATIQHRSSESSATLDETKGSLGTGTQFKLYFFFWDWGTLNSGIFWRFTIFPQTFFFTPLV